MNDIRDKLKALLDQVGRMDSDLCEALIEEINGFGEDRYFVGFDAGRDSMEPR